MAESKYWTALGRRRLPRRRLLRAGGLAGLGIGISAVAGCGSSKQSSKQGGAGGAPGPTAAAAQPQPGGILVQRLQTDPATLDIHQTSTYGAVWPEAPAYNQLIQFDPQAPDSKIIPDLADSYEIAGDGMSITFKLHPGVKFHDGAEFSSADVAANIDWIKHPPAKKASPRSGVLDTVERVETPDALTAKLILKRPTPSLLANLATHYLALGSKGDLAKGDLGTQLNGTGPYRLKGYTRGVGVDLERNPDYWVKGRPYLDGLKFSIVPDETTAFTQFIAGQFQHYYPVLAENVDRVPKETSGRASVNSKITPGGNYIFFNGVKKPFNDVRVRQAVSLAVDREACIQVVEHGLAQPGCYMKPGGEWALPVDQFKSVPGYDKPDLGAAKRLLEAAGVTEPLSGTILTRGDLDYRNQAIFVQGALQKAFGWNYQIDAKDSAAAYDAAYAGQFDLIAWRLGLSLDDPDATFAEIAITKAVRNWSKITDAEADALYEKQSQTLDTATRRQLVNQLQLRLMGIYQVIGLEFAKNHLGVWNTVQNFKRAAGLYVNQRYQDVWLSKA